MNQERSMKPKPRIVASLGKNAIEDVKSASEADMIEVRLDLVKGDPIQVIRSIRSSTSIPLIATLRWKAEGGNFSGSEAERIDLLHQASEYANFVDIELRAEQRDELISQINKPAIVSYHDFSGMPSPGNLRSLLQEISGTGAAIAKIAVTPASLKDNLMLLQLLLDADMPLCVIAMGEQGRHLRAVAPIYGSALTYGYISQAIAPGQMRVTDLRQALRILYPEMVSFKYD
jgi:3-dehydroquinate dehydratase I